MSMNFRRDPTADLDPDALAALEEKNRERIANWFDMSGVEPHYPLTSDEVVKLLRRVEYAADNDLLLDYTANGIIPPVARQNGRLVWSATNVVTFAAALEARRKWLPGTLHDHKLTLAEKIVRVYAARGQDGINDLASYDVDALLSLLVQLSGDAGAVQAIAEGLRLKLRQQGVVV